MFLPIPQVQKYIFQEQRHHYGNDLSIYKYDHILKKYIFFKKNYEYSHFVALTSPTSVAKVAKLFLDQIHIFNGIP